MIEAEIKNFVKNVNLNIISTPLSLKFELKI